MRHKAYKHGRDGTFTIASKIKHCHSKASPAQEMIQCVSNDGSDMNGLIVAAKPLKPLSFKNIKYSLSNNTQITSMDDNDKFSQSS